MRRLRTDFAVVFGILLFGGAVAVLLGSDFGLSWDELGIAQLGRAALLSYSTRSPLGALPADMVLYGPAYAAIVEWLSGHFVAVFPTWTFADARHVAYFLSFLMSAISVYVLSRGHAPPGPATAATALFLTQPLLFGHAFINPKDMPFAGLVALSMALGILATRMAAPSLIGEIPRSLWSATRRDRFIATGREAWRHRTRAHRVAFLAFLSLVASVAAELFLFQRIVLPIVRSTIREAYEGVATPVIQTLFARMATDAGTVPLSDYLHKGDFLYQGTSLLIVAMLVGMAAAWSYAIFRGPLSVLRFEAEAAQSRAELPAVGAGGAGRRLRWDFAIVLVGSAVVLGLGTAVRPVAPLAGVLVTGLLLLRFRSWRKRLLVVVTYWGVAIAVTYLAWPFLWEDPASRFVRVLQTMTNYPWQGAELFGGLAYHTFELPRYYGIFHIAIQLTVPAIVLGLAGMALGFMRPKSLYGLAETAVVFAWFALPPVFAALFRTPLYDSARQLLFAVTPIFVFSSIAFSHLASWVRPQALRILLATVLILPGAVGIARLHPYEYIYYNELVGGVAGANGAYELDYWGTSYREAMEFLAETAPPKPRIAVPYFWELAWPYGRKDFILWPADPDGADPLPDFAVITTRGNTQEGFWPNAPVFYEVEREGGILVVVRDLRRLDTPTAP